MKTNIILHGDWIERLKELMDKSVQCGITSPPYYGLRDYGHPDQLGMEKTPEEYIQKLVTGFREVRRVLRDDGTLWIVIGDSYAGTGKKDKQVNSLKQMTNRGATAQKGFSVKSKRGRKEDGVTRWGGGNIPCSGSLKPKDLIGIPWMLAFALRADGWYLRQEIIWAKAYTTLHRNHSSTMPESVQDRFVKSHEQIFLLSKSKKYFFDIEAVSKPITDVSSARLRQDIDAQSGSTRVPGKTNGNMKAVVKNLKRTDKNHSFHESRANGKEWTSKMGGGSSFPGHSGNYDADGYPIGTGMANKRSVWHHNPPTFKESHFATFPEDLLVDMVKAGSREGDVLIDPFFGAGTTGLVARKLNRDYIGIELNEKYIEIAQKRLYKELGMFV